MANRALTTRNAVIFLFVFCLLGGYVIYLRSFGAVNVPPTGSATPGRWLMTSALLSQLQTLDPTSADYFFNSPGSFAKSVTQPGLAASAIAGYTSYSQLTSDFAHGAFPSGVSWVMYDPENWSATPVNEQQHPATYLMKFAQAAHAHNLKVLEVPARDLVSTPGADCRTKPGESIDQGYLRCNIPADSQFADIFLIQSQGDQPDTATFANFVGAAKTQVRAANSSITVMAGLTTDRGDSAQQIFACWQDTYQMVDGYWMNSTNPTLPIAAQALDLIRASMPTATPSPSSPPTPTQAATPTPTSSPGLPSSPAPTPTPVGGPTGSGGSVSVSGAVNLNPDPTDPRATVTVDGATVSSNGNVDANYLTNGLHTVTITSGGKTTTKTINVQNHLNPYETLRNILFAGFKSNPPLMNAAMASLTILILGGLGILAPNVIARIRAR